MSHRHHPAIPELARGEAHAQLRRRRDETEILLVDPDGTPDERAGLIADAVAAVGDHPVSLWIDEPSDDDDRAAREQGLVPARELLQLRRPLPVDEPDELAVRPFRVGHDEQAWLAVNNAAFAHHREQGDLTLDDLRTRLAEPWFDPDGFLLHEVDGELLGFCWTKEHHDEEPALGEIFVIGTAPAAQGRGLGRALVLAGLGHLAGRGLGVGMLYVDADNTPARRLYDSLGFHTHCTRRLYLPA